MDETPEFHSKILDALDEGVYFVDRERRITFWNRGAENLTGLERDRVLGERCGDGILCHVDDAGEKICGAGCPLTKTIQDGEDREASLYLRHADGHRVAVLVRARPLRDEDGEIVGAVEIFRDNQPRLTAVKRLRDLEEMAYLDALTGLGNRRSAEQVLLARHQEAVRYGWNFGVIFIDLDEFKGINDRHGHAAGDEVLRLVAKNLEGALRVFDFAGRWGGEEFVAVVVNVDPDQLGRIAERFRMLIENSEIRFGGQRIRVTVSIGAVMSRPGEAVDDLVSRADALMYASKESGA
jgi:diguanylate cyclase (GGDEF)-like protein/PAS domain S-box-containing protein